MAHEDQQTARSPTSSTQCWPGSSPAMASGFGCSNGWSREANCREGQNPTDEQPPRLQTNEKPQSPVQRPIMSRDRKGQSEKNPYAHDTGSLRSDLQYCAVDYRGRQKRWLPYYPPQEETISWKLTTSWNQHALPEEGKPCMPQQGYNPAGAGHIEPMPPVPQAPENLLPQHAAVRATAVQESRDGPITDEAKDADGCARHDEPDLSLIHI